MRHTALNSIFVLMATCQIFLLNLQLVKAYDDFDSSDCDDDNFNATEETNEQDCNSMGFLSITPNTTVYFAKDDIIISGPCFKLTGEKIRVKFEEIRVYCVTVNMRELLCEGPPFDRIGNWSVSFRYNRIKYEGVLHVVDLDTENEANLIQEVGNGTESYYTIYWNTSDFGTSEDFLDLSGYQEDYYFDDDMGRSKKVSHPLTYPNIPNTGEYQLQLHNSRAKRASWSQVRKAVRLLIKLHPLARGLNPTFLIIYIISEVGCDVWYLFQPNAADMSKIIAALSSKYPCPCEVPEEFPPKVGDFVQDESCNPHSKLGPAACWFFHEGAKGCYRSNGNVAGRVVQCCYDSNGKLLIGPPGGGTVDFKDSSVSVWQHFMSDVLPWLACCVLTENCDKYYEKRPSIDCVRTTTAESTTDTTRSSTPESSTITTTYPTTGTQEASSTTATSENTGPETTTSSTTQTTTPYEESTSSTTTETPTPSIISDTPWFIFSSTTTDYFTTSTTTDSTTTSTTSIQWPTWIPTTTTTTQLSESEINTKVNTDFPTMPFFTSSVDFSTGIEVPTGPGLTPPSTTQVSAISTEPTTYQQS